ncbi:MAG: hypothetical protein M3O28_13695 [Actinomycetota bacterium]|nr:hypothetical protein [Actinomycetota bacterium]
MILAVLMAVGGSLLAYRSYEATVGPEAAVRGYYGALTRGDASAALGFGDLPPGGLDLTTASVLREQQRLAPIRGLVVTSTDRSGDRATVNVRYELGFAAGTQVVSDAVAVVSRHGTWRLTMAAISTALALNHAHDRATILGRTVPDQPVVMFPGAIPIRFDNPYLTLSSLTNSVQFGNAAGQPPLAVEVTDAGRSAVVAALSRALPQCLSGGSGAAAAATCPLPTPRAVPGSLRAQVTGQLANTTVVSVGADAAGVLDISADLPATGTYQALNFNNLAVTHSGPLTLRVLAHADAVAPVVIQWSGAGS